MTKLMEKTKKTIDPMAREQLMQIATGFWVSQSLFTAVKVGIADELKKKPQSIQELATRLNLHEVNLYRLMRALTSIGIFSERFEKDREVYELTPTSELLCTDTPSSLRPVILMLGVENYTAWGSLYKAVESGESPFEAVYGTEVYKYFQEHPARYDVFNQAMAAIVQGDNDAILEVCDFEKFLKIVDIGGGNGALLAAILSKTPHIEGTLFDLPEVIQNAETALESLGVKNRCTLESGDFFESVPQGGDCYILSRILHTFDDERAMLILKKVHEAIQSSGKLFLMEAIIDLGNDPSTARNKLMDLNMMAFASGGRDRTKEEYSNLLAASGFSLERVIKTKNAISVIECIKE